MDVTSIRVDLRATARVSFLFFVWAFTARGLVHFVPNKTTRWFDANRRKALLAFATSHTVHLGFILTLAARMGWAEFIHTFTWVTVVVGGAGFLLIWGLAWKALSKRMSAIAGDSRFEAFAYYYVWTIFLLTYIGASFKARFYILFALVALAAFLVRVSAARQSRRVASVSPAVD